MSNSMNKQNLRALATNAKKSSEGFSMVEVLVSLLILSIGLLGLASLQASGLRYSGNSALRTQALILTQDMIERIRANPTANVTDLTAWRAIIASQLPDGTGAITITIDSPTAGISNAVVTISWNEREVGGGATTDQSLVTSVQL